MKYSPTFGSFVRGGEYPLEADYIFSSVEELQHWAALNQGILHDGLLKIVKEENNQTLYWCYDKEFYPLCDLSTFENLELLKQVIADNNLIKELMKDLERRLKDKMKSLQEELDNTQKGVGLNGDGSFDTINVENTKYISGAKSILSCLKKLDEAISNKEMEAFIKEAYYDSNNEKLVFIFKTIQNPEGEKTEIDVRGIIEEWLHKDSESIRFTASRNAIGQSIITADVRIANRDHNILEQYSEGLMVRGDSDNIFHDGVSLEQVINDSDTRLKALEAIDHSKYLTEHQSLEGYAKTTEIESKIASAKTEVEAKIPSLEGYLTEEKAGETYPTKSEVSKQIAEAITGGEIDLTGYAKESWVNEQGFLKEHQSLVDYAKKSEIPSLSGYATEEYVNNKIQGIEVPEGYDDSELRGKIEKLEKIDHSKFLTEHQSLESYATKKYVDDEIVKAVTGGEIDLEAYATKEWVENKNYASKEDIINPICISLEFIDANVTISQEDHNKLFPQVGEDIADTIAKTILKTPIILNLPPGIQIHPNVTYIYGQYVFSYENDNILTIYTVNESSLEVSVEEQEISSGGADVSDVLRQLQSEIETREANEAQINAKLDNTPQLDAGLIPSSYLPSYVDDVIEYVKEVNGSNWKTDAAVTTSPGNLIWCAAASEYAEEYYRKFVRNTNMTENGLTIVEPEPGKIYVNTNNDKTYRWSGSNLVEISKSIGLGETASTAYPGNKGKSLETEIDSLETKIENNPWERGEGAGSAQIKGAYADGIFSVAEGDGSTASGYISHAEGWGSFATGYVSHAEGRDTKANGSYSHTGGFATEANNTAEVAFGTYNNSVKTSSEFGDKANTLFTIGNGTSDQGPKYNHNAFEVRQDGSILIPNNIKYKNTPYYQIPMMNLQQVLKDLENKVEYKESEYTLKFEDFSEKGENVYGFPLVLKNSEDEYILTDFTNAIQFRTDVNSFDFSINNVIKYSQSSILNLSLSNNTELIPGYTSDLILVNTSSDQITIRLSYYGHSLLGPTSINIPANGTKKIQIIASDVENELIIVE